MIHVVQRTCFSFRRKWAEKERDAMNVERERERERVNFLLLGAKGQSLIIKTMGGDIERRDLYRKKTKVCT